MEDSPARPASVRDALAIIAQTPVVVRGLLEGASPEAIEGSADGEWGARQVLEHLIDAEGVAFRERIGRILNEDRPLLRSIDPPARLREGGYAGRSVEDLLGELDRMRAEDVQWLGAIDPADFQREGQHDEAGTVKVGQLIHYWAVHDLLHLRQLMSSLQSKLQPQIGNMHLFLED